MSALRAIGQSRELFVILWHLDSKVGQFRLQASFYALGVTYPNSGLDLEFIGGAFAYLLTGLFACFWGNPLSKESYHHFFEKIERCGFESLYKYKQELPSHRLTPIMCPFIHSTDIYNPE